MKKIVSYWPIFGQVKIVPEDEVFMLRIMERDDITLISEGLCASLDPKLCNFDYIASSNKYEYYHKIRRFQQHIIPDESPSQQKYDNNHPPTIITSINEKNNDNHRMNNNRDNNNNIISNSTQYNNGDHMVDKKICIYI